MYVTKGETHFISPVHHLSAVGEWLLQKRFVVEVQEVEWLQDNFNLVFPSSEIVCVRERCSEVK